MKHRTTWQSLSTALVISKDDLAPERVTRQLGVDPDFTCESGENSVLDSGDGCWSLVCAAVDITASVETLLQRVSPLAEKLVELEDSGCDVRIDISGRVDAGSHLSVPASVLSRLAELGFPVSLTAETVPVDQYEGDFFDWLPENGSHRAE